MQYTHVVREDRPPDTKLNFMHEVGGEEGIEIEVMFLEADRIRALFMCLMSALSETHGHDTYTCRSK